MAACLMLTPEIRAGLDQWNVFGQEVWTRSMERHEGKTIQQILDETYPAETAP